MKYFVVWFLAAVTAQTVLGQTSLSAGGVVPPRRLTAVEPDYSDLARRERISGSVILQIVIDQAGLPTNIAVIRPLGFGLDEKAIEAVQKWTFVPGAKNGLPVAVIASVEVNFKMLPDRGDDERERRQAALRTASATLEGAGADTPETKRAVKSIQDLAKHGYPPAMYALGMLEIEGRHVAKHVPRGLEMIERAADRNCAPALYELGLRRLEGRDLPEDVTRGFDEMHEAARRGNTEAQFYLGDRYERGDGLPRDIDNARHYLGLCAARGVARCQYRFGLPLIDAPRLLRAEEQGVAWIQLAAEQGLPEAKESAAMESARLTREQLNSMKEIKALITAAH